MNQIDSTRKLLENTWNAATRKEEPTTAYDGKKYTPLSTANGKAPSWAPSSSLLNLLAVAALGFGAMYRGASYAHTDCEQKHMDHLLAERDVTIQEKQCAVEKKTYLRELFSYLNDLPEDSIIRATPDYSRVVIEDSNGNRLNELCQPLIPACDEREYDLKSPVCYGGLSRETLGNLTLRIALAWGIAMCSYLGLVTLNIGEPN